MGTCATSRGHVWLQQPRTQTPALEQMRSFAAPYQPTRLPAHPLPNQAAHRATHLPVRFTTDSGLLTSTPVSASNASLLAAMDGRKQREGGAVDRWGGGGLGWGGGGGGGGGEEAGNEPRRREP